MGTTPGQGGTPVTEEQVVAYITSQWGAAKAAQFQAWYAAAVRKDPALTPAEGADIWLIGEGLATGIGKIGTFTAAQVPDAAAGAAAKAASSLPNPLSGIDAVGAFFATLTQANTWTRLLKIITGGILLTAGIIKMTGAGTQLGPLTTAARKLPGV